ncbi:MAG: hypothetical protein KAI66_04380, partial [Lentisphaeria bacterium]|nr:hypothetical protein [Lentisphaeria bacterium]
MKFFFAFWAVCLCLAISASAVKGAEPVEIKQGEYRAVVSERGLAVYHGETRLSLGSYFTIFTPEYKGSLLSYGAFWKSAKVRRWPSGIEATADLPGGRVRYRVDVQPDGVDVELGVILVAGADRGPTEYAAFQIPPDLVAGGTVQILNVAGAVVEKKAVPETPKRGGMTRSGDVMRIHTADRTLEVSAGNGMGVYVFDARVEQYGARRGLWVFSGIPAAPSYEVMVQRRLRVLPPPQPRPEGVAVFADGSPVTRILVRKDAPERERLAASELASYIEKICGRKLTVTETDGPVGSAGDFVFGELAVSTGLISRKELKPMDRDGYVVRVERNRGAVCGWRDLGTVYGAYALIRQLGVKFYAPGCEIVPQTETLTMPACEIRRKPLLEFRQMTQNLKLGHTPSSDQGNPREIGEAGGLVHAAAYLVPFDMYHEEHPEYFALQKDGKRLHRDPKAKRFDVHLCLSNPDVQRVSGERLMILMDKQPDRTFFG